jgi:5S rRNA maturation endonuclease (ribonuclease M5)
LLLKPNDRIIVFILGKTDKEKIENLFLEDWWITNQSLTC